MIPVLARSYLPPLAVVAVVAVLAAMLVCQIWD